MPDNAVMHKADGVALKDYVDTRFDSVCKEINKAEDILNLRLQTMNEFRESLKDQASRFVTRDELKLQMSVISDDIREVRDFMAAHRGKASLNQVYIAYVLALISMIVGAVLHFVK